MYACKSGENPWFTVSETSEFEVYVLVVLCVNIMQISFYNVASYLLTKLF